MMACGTAWSDWRGGGGHWGNPHWGHPWHDEGAAGGIVGGMIGSWLWNQFNQPPPPPVEVPELAPGTPAWNAYCLNKYRTFNPATGTYIGFDGQAHACQ